MQTVLRGQQYSEYTMRRTFVESVLERVQALPGVEGAGFASDLPFTSQGNTYRFRVEGRPEPPNAVALDTLYREVTNDYLQTIGARLKEGRFFRREDRTGSLPVVIINDTFAKTFWPNESAVGKRIQVGNIGLNVPWLSIVGVVDDVHERGLLLPMKPGTYLPISQVSRPDPWYLSIRTARDPLSSVTAVRRAIWSVDCAQPISEIKTMRELMDQETANRREVMTLLDAFAGLALLLAALGIYGVLSYAVAQRTQEIGIRMAMGAERGDVLRMVMTQGLGVALIGIVVGLTAALALARLMTG